MYGRPGRDAKSAGHSFAAPALAESDPNSYSYLAVAH